MSLRQDIGYGWRLWRKHPLPGMLSVGALALGIAAASAIFTLVNAIAIQPLPYRDSDRLVILWSVNERLGIDVKRQKSQTTSLSILEYQDWLVRSGIFEHMVIFASTLPRVTQTDDPGGIQVYVTSPGLFPMLGVKPLLGRGFEPADERRGADPVIVLQHELWMRRFRGDPSVIGQKIYLNNRPTTVIGVMGPEFVFFNRQMDAMSPAEFEAPSDSRAREFRGFRAMARLKPDLSLSNRHRPGPTRFWRCWPADLLACGYWHPIALVGGAIDHRHAAPIGFKRQRSCCCGCERREVRWAAAPSCAAAAQVRRAEDRRSESADRG